MLDPLDPSFGEHPRTPPSIHRRMPISSLCYSDTHSIDSKICILGEENLTGSTRWRPLSQELLALITLTVLSLTIALSATSTLTSLQAIAQALESTSTETAWVGYSYLITSAASMPLFSSLSHTFSESVLMSSSIAILTIGTILSSAAYNVGMLIVGRSIQGVGAAGISILCMVIFTHFVPMSEWPRYFSIIQIAQTIGMLLGPIIGGAVVERTTWKWTFYMHLPSLVVCLLVFPHLRVRSTPAVPIPHGLAKLNCLREVAFVASIVLLLVALALGGSQFSWSSPATILPLLTGGFGVVAVLLYKTFIVERHQAGVACVTNITIVVLNCLSMIQGITFLSWVHFTSFYLRAMQRLRPMEAGVALVPFPAGITLGSLLSTILVARCGTLRWSIWIGWLITASFTGLSIHWGEGTPPQEWICIAMLNGIGHGCILQAQTFAGSFVVRPADSGRAAATALSCRNIGSALGVILGSTAFQNVMRVRLKKEGLPQSIALQAEKYVAVLRDTQEARRRLPLSASFVEGFKGVYLFLMSSAVFALGLSLIGIKSFPSIASRDSPNTFSVRVAEHSGRVKSYPAP